MALSEGGYGMASEGMYGAVAVRPYRERTVPELSRDDLELLALIATGVTADVAAQRLMLSTRAIRRHLRSICDRLGVGSRMEAVVWAAHRRLI